MLEYSAVFIFNIEAIMYINNLASNPGDDSYYNENFYTILESHIPYFKTNKFYTVTTLNPIDGVVYEGDLFGLLDKLMINKQYHYFIMRFNGYVSPDELKKETQSLLIPNMQELDLLQRQYQTRKTLV